MKGEKTAVSPIHSVSGCRRGVVLIPTKVTKRIRGDDGVAPTGPIYGSSRTHMPQPSLFVLTMTCGGQLINNPVSHFYREAAVPTWPGQSPPPPHHQERTDLGAKDSRLHSYHRSSMNSVEECPKQLLHVEVQIYFLWRAPICLILVLFSVYARQTHKKLFHPYSSILFQRLPHDYGVGTLPCFAFNSLSVIT